MASPSEYRDVLWAALHDGEVPSGNGGKGATKSDVDEMQALLEKAKALRGESPDLDS